MVGKSVPNQMLTSIYWSQYDPTKRKDRRALNARCWQICAQASHLKDTDRDTFTKGLELFIDKMPGCSELSATKVQLQYQHRYALASQYARRPNAAVALALAQPLRREKPRDIDLGLHAKGWTTGSLYGLRATYTALINETAPDSELAARAAIQGVFAGKHLDDIVRQGKNLVAALKTFAEKGDDRNALKAWSNLWWLFQNGSL